VWTEDIVAMAAVTLFAAVIIVTALLLMGQGIFH
jgi:hypothetical protein